MHESFRWSRLVLVPALLLCSAATAGGDEPRCVRTVVANVVALDQPLVLNRLGAREPGGMMFALQRDVVAKPGQQGLRPGQVQLRQGKRPRPLVLRVNVGDCLRIEFSNLLAPLPIKGQSAHAGVNVIGLSPVHSIEDNGSLVGNNPSGLLPPGEPPAQPGNRRYSAVYTYYAAQEGTFLLHSPASNSTTIPRAGGAIILAGQLTYGLFGAVHVEPKDSEWYRSQVTQEELQLATHGTSPGGHPQIDYAALYPEGYRRADGTLVPPGTPVLRMLNAEGEIVHGDLTALITGPRAGRLTVRYPDNPALPDRSQPFRELTTIYHEMLRAAQAFEYPEEMRDTMQAGADQFGINYGTSGMGAELWANRINTGPGSQCTECKFEEFFLSSWTGGDPSLLVDVPANARSNQHPHATRALFPDDPSNVYHSYLNDHVRFRVLHGGGALHHIHHIHAHQWLHAAASDQSQYQDSQAIGPGSGYTLEMTYAGSGNRNRTPGDSIFHCHFYPHFAAGMWSLWRVHDVFEPGTRLDGLYPAAMSRALPDGEIERGTPTPAVVPLPTLPMAPMPAPVHISQGQAVVDARQGNPGFPFFVPGIAGHRPPHPPLDFAVVQGRRQDGGLPRHVVRSGEVGLERHTRLDFSKEVARLDAVELPEEGTAVEQVAMDFHARGQHPSFLPDGAPGAFLTNGRPRQPGAPFADPCSSEGQSSTMVRRYKAANLQLDVTLNKKGWHFPQTRLVALWEDVRSTLEGRRPPEPLFFRANSGECVEYWHTNLIPGYYLLDDYQVRTPVDILGQHIHLVKFDVTASDGAANGFNYEDGSFSPDQVRSRIAAINQAGGLERGGQRRRLEPVPAPAVFGSDPGGQWLGAQTTIQRWHADTLLDNAGKDRTLRTVFTHDHFGPSTHQQAGLYGALLVEPQGSRWRDPVTGTFMGTREDGGPTSFQADILTPNTAESYREFALIFQDMQPAYLRDSKSHPSDGNWLDPSKAVGAPRCPPPAPPPAPPAPPQQPPCPDLVGQPDTGSASVNYRSEPLPYRLAPPPSLRPASLTQSAKATDTAHAFQSMARNDPELNRQPAPLLTPGMEPFDPYTPLLRAYEGDRVQVRLVAGAHNVMHNFTLHGVKWLFEPSNPNSGFRNSQALGISEHFELEFTLARRGQARSDYLYLAGASLSDMENGAWGLLRAYGSPQPALQPLPNNPAPASKTALTTANAPEVCPPEAPRRRFEVVATTAHQALPDKALIYYRRGVDEVSDPYAILYARKEDLDPATGRFKPGVPIEPLILRAAAGECLEITLENRVNPDAPVFSLNSPSTVAGGLFRDIPIKTSTHVGLHPQLVAYDVSKSNGVNVGINPIQTVEPGGQSSFQWYAGSMEVGAGGKPVWKPLELGAVNLFPSDVLRQPSHSLAGALIIEPPYSRWVEDANSRASAFVMPRSSRAFRELVVISQEGLDLSVTRNQAPLRLRNFQALNYGTEPFLLRYGTSLEVPGPAPAEFACATSNRLQQVPGAPPVGEPQTPVFTTVAGMPTRIRLLHSGGVQSDGNAFILEGHSWQEMPYVYDSALIGYNTRSEVLSTVQGHGPTNHADLVLLNAGGKFQVPGDYLLRTFVSQGFANGAWALMRVVPYGRDAVVINRNEGGLVSGVVSVVPTTGRFAASVSLYAGRANAQKDGCQSEQALGKAAVDPSTGHWVWQGEVPAEVCVRSEQGGVGTWGPEVLAACKPLQRNAPQVATAREPGKQPAAAETESLPEHLLRRLQRLAFPER